MITLVMSMILGFFFTTLVMYSEVFRFILLLSLAVGLVFLAIKQIKLKKKLSKSNWDSVMEDINDKLTIVSKIVEIYDKNEKAQSKLYRKFTRTMIQSRIDSFSDAKSISDYKYLNDKMNNGLKVLHKRNDLSKVENQEEVIGLKNKIRLLDELINSFMEEYYPSAYERDVNIIYVLGLSILIIWISLIQTGLFIESIMFSFFVLLFMRWKGREIRDEKESFGIR